MKPFTRGGELEGMVDPDKILTSRYAYMELSIARRVAPIEVKRSEAERYATPPGIIPPDNNNHIAYPLFFQG